VSYCSVLMRARGQIDRTNRMTAINSHLSQPVVSRGPAVIAGATTTIALHGRGRDPNDILGVWQRIGRSDLACLAPAAEGGTWYPASFLANITDNEPRLSFALERIDTLVHELGTRGVHREHIVLAGFSQGACLLSEYVLRNPTKYAALLIFTGGAIGPEGTKWSVNGSFDDTPVLIGGSVQDAFVPLSRMQETARILRTHGANVTELYYGGTAHYVSDDEIHLARRVLEKRWSPDLKLA
jgi:predicted esterase